MSWSLKSRMACGTMAVLMIVVKEAAAAAAEVGVVVEEEGAVVEEKVRMSCYHQMGREENRMM